MQKLKDRKGFTLIELLVGLAITVIIMTGVFSVLSGSIKPYQYSRNKTYEAQQARAALLILTADIRKANGISAGKGAANTQLTYQYEDDAGNLSTFTVALGTGTQSHTLLRGTQALTANIVENVLFERDPEDGRIMKITITINDPQDTFSGNYVLSTEIFSPNLTP